MNLPSLIAAAYSLYSQRQAAEALNGSWIVIEQLLDHYWKLYVNSLNDKKRRKRLSDTRAYTATVRTEILQAKEILPELLCNELHSARRERNELAHRASTSAEMSDVGLKAMRSMIEFFCENVIEPPLAVPVMNW